MSFMRMLAIHTVCECHEERIIATKVRIFVNAGHLVNVLDEELLQPKYQVCKLD